MNLTRSKKLLYGFMLVGCFLTVMAVDDSPEQEEISKAHKEWIVQQASRELAKAEQERFYGVQPETISDPAFAGKPDWNKQFALLRKDFEARKELK